jgi:hypothetical protein
MDLPGGPGQDGGRASAAPSTTLFAPLVFHDGLGWEPVTGPQPTARAACLKVTALIHLLTPGVTLWELDGRAEEAIRALEAGVVSVTVIDDRHRVDRAGPCPAAGP